MLAAHSPGLTSGGFRGWSPGYAEQSEQLSFCALHCLGRSQIRLRVSRRLQRRQWCLHIPVAIAFDELAFGAEGLTGEHAWAVQIQPRIEHLLVERVDGFGVLLRDVAVAHVFAHHAGIFALRQRVVIADLHRPLARARFGLLHEQLLRNLATQPLMYSEPLSE